MDLKIRREDYNALLKRKEVQVEVDHDEKGTPSRLELRKALATKYGTKPDNVYVIDVASMTGTQHAICEIQVYDDPQSAQRIVPKYIQTRNLPPEERKRLREREAKKEETKPARPEKPKEQKPKDVAKAPAEAPKKGKESESK